MIFILTPLMNQASAMSLLGAAFGAGRTDMGWGGIETVPGHYNFAGFDLLYPTLAANNVTPYMIFDYGNSLYKDPFNTTNPNTPAQWQAMTNYAYAAIERYRNTSTFWEMYNEPNGGFWVPNNVTGFNGLATSIGQMIRENFPEQYYVGPAAAGIDFNWILANLQGGLANYFDAISFHPYTSTQTPEYNIVGFSNLRAMVRPYMPNGKFIPVIPGEWGYSVTWLPNVTVQSEYVPRARYVNILTESPLSMWYDFHDDGTDPTNQEHNFGTLFYNFTAKLGYNASLFSSEFLEYFSYNKQLVVTPAPLTDFLLLFSNPRTDSQSSFNKVVFVFWTTNTDGITMNIPCGVDQNGNSFTDVGTNYAIDGTNLGAVTCTSGSFSVSASVNVAYLSVNNPNPFIQSMTAIARLPLDVAMGGPIPVSVLNPLSSPLSISSLSNGELVDSATVSPYSAQTFYIDPYTIYQWFDGLASSVQFWVPVQLQLSSGTFNPFNFTMVAFPRKSNLLILPQPVDSNGNIQISVFCAAAPLDQTFSISFFNYSGSCCTPNNGPSNNVSTIRFSIPSGSTYYDAGIIQSSNGSTDSFMPYSLQATLFDYTNVVQSNIPLTTFSLPYIWTSAAAMHRDIDGPNTTWAVGTLSFQNPPTGGIPIGGLNAMRLDYNNPFRGAYYVMIMNSGSYQINGALAGFSMWIYGDSSSSCLKMIVVDATGESFQLVGPALTWSGWQLVNFDWGSVFYYGGADVPTPTYPVTLGVVLLVDATCAPNYFNSTSTVYFLPPFMATIP